MNPSDWDIGLASTLARAAEPRPRLEIPVKRLDGKVAVVTGAATKAAVRSFARTAGTELLGRNIRVNAVAPGPIATPIIERSGITTEQIEDYKAAVPSRVPMRRMGLPEEVAGAVAFLASDDVSYITGVELNVDGGMANL